jgi:hypothetical protein
MRFARVLPVALCLFLAGAVQAEPPAPNADFQNAEARDAKWSARLEKAQVHRDQARLRVIASEAALSRARHRDYPRGEALAEIESEVEAARKELAAAERELPELLEEARLAGVSPDVLLRFEDETQDPAAGQSD